MLVTAKVNVRSTFCLRLLSVTTPEKHYPCFLGILAVPLSCDFLTLNIELSPYGQTLGTLLCRMRVKLWMWKSLVRDVHVAGIHMTRGEGRLDPIRYLFMPSPDWIDGWSDRWSKGQWLYMCVCVPSCRAIPHSWLAGSLVLAYRSDGVGASAAAEVKESE